MIFNRYGVEIELVEHMLGTVPKDPAVYARYVASKAPSPDLANEEIAVEETREDIEKAGWTGFHQDEEGLFVYNYLILGFLKEAGNTLKTQLNIKNLRSKIDQFVYVQPRRIRIGKEPTGVIERPLRAMTMQGPRVTVTRSDYVPEGTVIRFEVSVLENKEINARVLQELLAFGAFKGLGQFRTGSYGQFKVVRFADLGRQVTAVADILQDEAESEAMLH